MKSKPAAEMTDKEIETELEKLGDQWSDLRSDPDAGHAGSPGEWMYERMDELETERKKRR